MKFQIFIHFIWQNKKYFRLKWRTLYVKSILSICSIYSLTNSIDILLFLDRLYLIMRISVELMYGMRTHTNTYIYAHSGSEHISHFSEASLTERITHMCVSVSVCVFWCMHSGRWEIGLNPIIVVNHNGQNVSSVCVPISQLLLLCMWFRLAAGWWLATLLPRLKRRQQHTIHIKCFWLFYIVSWKLAQ